VNAVPEGPLGNFVRQLKLPKLSPFQVEGPCSPIEKCTLALTNIVPCMQNCRNNSNLMTPNEIPNLISFLLSSGYQIETQLTNMMNQSETRLSDKRLTMIVTYYGKNSPQVMYMR